MKTITGYELKDGMVVYVEGHPMTVKNPRVVKSDVHPIQNKDVVRFEGICTDDSVNNAIRHTSYNGGTYGQLAEMTYTVI